MRLYEYDEAIENAFDQETGEILEDVVNALWAEKNQRLENLLKYIKSEEADVEALRAEEKNLAERRRAKENRAIRGRAFLQMVLHGEKFECPAGAISYRKTNAVEIASAPALIKWAEQTGQEQVLKYKDPEISKTELKKLIEADGPVKVPPELARIVSRASMQIK